MIRRVALLFCVIWVICILILLNAEITIKKPSVPVNQDIELQDVPMMYTWDDGGDC